MKNCSVSLIVFILIAFSVQANQNPPNWIKEGPYLSDHSASFEIPVKVVSSKLYVEIEFGGTLRRFVVDTGSPSMIDKKLSEELGLKEVGDIKGIDAHGMVIKNKVVQGNFRLGGVEFNKAPMITADFSKSTAARYFIGDGVLGSEILSLGVWQYDLKNSFLRFNTDLNKMPNIDRAVKLKLYQFGYPFMPIFDVKFSDNARSKAMFDTGSPDYFAISSADFKGTSKDGGIGRIIKGYGSPGHSLGGQAPDENQFQVELKELFLGDLKLGRVEAIQRKLSPSLIGARFLEHFVVTLDSRSGKAYFKEYYNGPFVRPSFGFTLSFNNSISVALVWEESPAEASGLRSGMKLTSINGVPTEYTEKGIQRAIKAMEGQDIEITWEGGGSARLTRKNLLF